MRYPVAGGVHAKPPAAPCGWAMARPRWQPMIARGVGGAVMAIIAGLFVLALPGSATLLATPCPDPVNQCLLAPEQVASLAHFGITPQAVALVAIVLSALALLLADSAAAVLLWRRANDRMALLVSLALMLFPVTGTPVLGPLRAHPGIWQMPASIFAEAGSIAFLLLIATFPSGRFVPRWFWLPWLAVVLLGSPASALLPLPGEFVALAILGLLLVLGASQLYRYRRVSTAVERQQTKWIAYGFTLIIVLNQLVWQPYIHIPALHRPESLFLLLLAYPVDFVTLLILVVAFGVAILRYRLWDIDFIVNRALVYGSLTAILALVYAAGVIGGQATVATITHTRDQPQSSVTIVATTLIIAALFQPLRRRLQAIIDRRFYRRKYNAARTLAAFATTLRHETDLPTLTGHLLAVVAETVQPTHVSLWLRHDGDHRRERGIVAEPPTPIQ